MEPKKIVLWTVLVLAAFLVIFFWLLGGAVGVIMTIETLMKITFGILFTGFVSYWIGYYVCHHRMSKKNM